MACRSGTAHHAVGAAVRDAVAAGETELTKVELPDGAPAGAATGLPSLHEVVAGHDRGGGPGECDRVVHTLRRSLAAHGEWLTGRRHRLGEAEDLLDGRRRRPARRASRRPRGSRPPAGPCRSRTPHRLPGRCRVTWFALLESNTTGTGREFCARARARGMRPVLLTRDPGRYPYAAQDRVGTRVLDTRDLTAVLDACAALDADGGLAGIASSSEYFVPDAARAAAALGLPAADGEALARCRAKDLQREALAAGGLPVPAFRAVETVPDAVRAADAIGHPVVLKPTTGSGSVGVRLCRDREETRLWADELLGRATDERGNPVPGRILVESAVTGAEFSVETFDGAVVTVVAKHLGPQPYFVETGHDIPAPVPEQVTTALADTALRALAALGLGWGAAHTELRLSHGRPVVIEVNPRLAGGMIPVAVRAGSVPTWWTRSSPAPPAQPLEPSRAFEPNEPPPVVGPVPGPHGAAGTSGAHSASGARHAAVRFLRTEEEGRVAAVDGLADARAVPGIVIVAADTAEGATVRLTHSFQDRLRLRGRRGPGRRPRGPPRRGRRPAHRRPPGVPGTTADPAGTHARTPRTAGTQDRACRRHPAYRNPPRALEPPEARHERTAPIAPHAPEEGVGPDDGRQLEEPGVHQHPPLDRTERRR